MGTKKQKTVTELKAEKARIEERIRAAERAEKERIGGWVQTQTGLTELTDIKNNYSLNKK